MSKKHEINWPRLGKIFAAKRHMLNLSQQHISDLLKVTRASIANFERGNQKFPLERLSQLCRLYGLSFELFITEGDPCHAYGLISAETFMPVSVAATKEDLIKAVIEAGTISSEENMEAEGYYVSQIIWSIPQKQEAPAVAAS